MDFKRRSIWLILFFSTLIFSGCAFFSQEASVRDYNNKIVAIQQKMLQTAQESVKALTGQKVEPTKAAGILQKVLADVQKNYDEFKAINVPKGAEDLATAMKKFFEVEIQGMINLVTSLQNYKGKTQDEAAFKALLDKINDFSKQESDVLLNFGKVQQSTASKYGEKVEAKP